MWKEYILIIKKKESGTNIFLSLITRMTCKTVRHLSIVTDVIFLIVTIAFKPMASAHDYCSYNQTKTPIGFLCKRDFNLGPLLNDKRLYQLS